MRLGSGRQEEECLLLSIYTLGCVTCVCVCVWCVYFFYKGNRSSSSSNRQLAWRILHITYTSSVSVCMRHSIPFITATTIAYFCAPQIKCSPGNRLVSVMNIIVLSPMLAWWRRRRSRRWENIILEKLWQLRRNVRTLEFYWFVCRMESAESCDVSRSLKVQMNK